MILQHLKFIIINFKLDFNLIFFKKLIHMINEFFYHSVVLHILYLKPLQKFFLKLKL